MTKLRWFLVVSLMIGAFALAACGGDDDDGTASPTATEVQEEPTDGEPTEEPADSDGGDGDGGADIGDLREFAERFVDSTFVATYNVQGDLAGGEFQEFTIYKDGTDRIRFDVKGTVEGQDLSAIVIQTPGVSAFCLEDAGELAEIFGLPAGEGVCLGGDSPINGDIFSGITEDLETVGEDSELIDKDDREVAGEDADCFTARDTTTGEETEVCIGKDSGALLYLSGEDGTVLEATSVSTDVSDSDFEPPYEITDIPGLTP